MRHYCKLGVMACVIAGAVSVANALPTENGKKIGGKEKAEMPLPLLTASQLAMAERVYVGQTQCGSQHVRIEITKIEGNPGYFRLKESKAEYVMSPSLNAASVVRLEDAKRGMAWIQVANTSMLLNMRTGQRVQGDCLTAQQQQVAQEISTGQEKGLINVAELEASTTTKVERAPGSAHREKRSKHSAK